MLGGAVKHGDTSFKLCAFLRHLYLRCFKSLFGVQLLFHKVDLPGKGSER